MAWIAVDLDGTLAVMPEDRVFSPLEIGPPVPAMVARVQRWLAKGRDVRIFTARVDGFGLEAGWGDVEAITAAIQAWCVAHIGQPLPVTSRKDYQMWQLWDDRAVRVIPNTGVVCCEAAGIETLARGLLTHGRHHRSCPGTSETCTCGFEALQVVAQQALRGRRR